jgi:hypothetical protein
VAATGAEIRVRKRYKAAAFLGLPPVENVPLSLDLATLMLFEWPSVNATRILSGETEGPRSADSLVKQSLLYREFQAEHDEILRHKWYESEKRGHDIGFELAQVDWRIKHGSQWRKEWQQKRFASAIKN